MTRYHRLRRVLILCHHCAANIAYYRAGYMGREPAYDTGSNFWVTANGNFLDIAVLEWCKLFGGGEDHVWSRVVADKTDFERGLLKVVGMDAMFWEAYITSMRTYRDKFLAHLDSENTMNIPRLTPAIKSVLYYAEYLVAQEDSLARLEEGDRNVRAHFTACEDDAARRYGRKKPLLA